MTRRKSRKVFGVILILLSLIVAMIPTGQTEAEDSTKSKLSDFELSGTTLIKYTGTAETVSVPDSVKVIADEAFINNAYMVNLELLKKVVVPDSVTEIGSAAFCNCTSLTDVTIGIGVERMGSGVFTGCPQLSTVTISENEKKISTSTSSNSTSSNTTSGNTTSDNNTVSENVVTIKNEYFVC